MPTKDPNPSTTTIPAAVARDRLSYAAATLEVPKNPNPKSNVNPVKRAALSNAGSEVSRKSVKVTPPSPPAGPRDASSIGASQFDQMTLASSQKGPTSGTSAPAAPQVLNPSNVPNPSAAGNVQRIPASLAGSNLSAMTQAPQTWCPVAKLSNRSRDKYHRGDIVNVPFHAANLDKYLSPNDKHLALTYAGYAYSKRRYAIILWVTNTDIFCVPLYTFQHKGMSAIYDPERRKEYVCLKSRHDNKFVNTGDYPALITKVGQFDRDTCVHITAGFVIDCKADIALAGTHIDNQSSNELYSLWKKLTDAARNNSI